MNLGVSMEISQCVAAAYDRLAAAYAEKNATMPPAYLDLGPRFLGLVRPGRAVLDVGCGAGRDLVWHTEQGASVVGGDRSPGMLAQARHLARTRGRAPGRLPQLDMRSLPFGDGVFVGVWCSASLLHLPKRHEALRVRSSRDENGTARMVSSVRYGPTQ